MPGVYSGEEHSMKKGTASAKALRQKYALCIGGTARRPVWLMWMEYAGRAHGLKARSTSF
jgi:hypothetical protein